MHDSKTFVKSVEPAERDISVATYNIHRCRGRDGRRDPERIVQIIREINADIIGLQELDTSAEDRKGSCHIHDILEEIGLNVVHGAARGHRLGRYGNALITTHRILDVRQLNLSVPWREPRCALDVDLDVDGTRVQVIVTHLGLRAYERRYQVRRLLDVISREDDRFVIMLGDFNEWLPVNGRARSLCSHLGKCPRRRTFPSGYPFLALDRIWVRPQSSLTDIYVHDSPAARVASDHLPLKGRIILKRGSDRKPMPQLQRIGGCEL